MIRPARSAAVVAAAVLAFLTVVLAGPSAAQEPAVAPAPPTTTTTSAAPATTPPMEPVAPVPVVGGPSGVFGDVDDIVAADPSPSCVGSDAGVGEGLVPEGCWGDFPSANFDIGCDEGAWNHLTRKIYCTFTDLAFQAGRAATAFGAWVAGWAYSFDAAGVVAEPAVAMAQLMESRIVGPLDLGGLAWLVMVTWVAFTALRGRVTQAAGEFVVSVLLVGLAGIVLSNPAGYLSGAYDTMGRLSTITLAAGTGAPPPTDQTATDTVVAPIQAQIHAVFVEEPYNIINWGVPAEAMAPACVDARNRILATGPHGGDDAPRQAMDAAGCEELADFNHQPTAQRLFGAVLAMVAALIMVILVGLVSLTVVVAQLAVAAAFAISPFAAAAAVLPGSGRTVAIRWVMLLFRAMLAMVAMSFLLAMVLMFIQALLEASSGLPLFARFALVDVTVVVAILARRRILGAGANTVASAGSTAAQIRPGSTAPGRSTLPARATPAGVSGFALTTTRTNTPSRIGRAAGTVGRYKLQERAYNRRSSRPHATEHTTLAGDGTWTRTVSVAGPAATTRRARAARARVEHRAEQARQ